MTDIEVCTLFVIIRYLKKNQTPILKKDKIIIYSILNNNTDILVVCRPSAKTKFTMENTNGNLRSANMR